MTKHVARRERAKQATSTSEEFLRSVYLLDDRLEGTELANSRLSKHACHSSKNLWNTRVNDEHER